jgi:hypothetical protein
MCSSKTGFFYQFIETKDDGHDFFPYAEWMREYGREPTADEIAEFINLFVVSWQPLPTSPPHINATRAALIQTYLNNGAYRTKVVNEAATYVIDIDWSKYE